MSAYNNTPVMGVTADQLAKGITMQSTVATPSEAISGKHVNRAGKYLTFHLGREEFAIQVLKVREIMGIQDITAVPQTPECVKGVINLRGKVIPVVDLRLKFGLPEIEYTQRTCIIVVQVQAAATSMLMGIIVDGVSEVLNLTATDIEDTPDFGQGVATPYLLGMAKVKGKVKILLDIDQILSSQGLLTGLESVLQ
jgi:purine-binding chemotaxis protein CheW